MIPTLSMNYRSTPQLAVEQTGLVYCPICTHTVEATIVVGRKSTYVMPGQKCSRCKSSLDAGYVMRVGQAAA